MSIEGKKLKQHIGKIKEAIDNISSADVESILPCYLLTLISELSQRGVVVPIDIGVDKILQEIINTAGKSLLSENQVKAPLIAGAAVVSALATQKLADMMLKNVDYSHIMDRTKCGGAVQRCQDVDDNRLLCLLNLTTNPDLGKDSLEDFEGRAMLLLRVTFGNNLRAASFSNPEQPPMFKRCLDSCLKLQVTLISLNRKVCNEDGIDEDDDYLSYYTPDAIQPLSNLIRIAESKQNTKRVAELSLRIAQSYLSWENHFKSSDVLSESGYQLWKDINGAFVETYTELESGKDSTSDNARVNRVLEAKKFIGKPDASSFDGDKKLKFLHNLLQVRVQNAYEDLLVDIISNRRYTLSRNRIDLSGTRKTKNTFEDEVKRQLVEGTLPAEDAEGIAHEFDSVSADSSSAVLRDAFLTLPRGSYANVGGDLYNAICSDIASQIDRLVLRSQSVALRIFKKKKRDAVDTAWDDVLTFINPLLISIVSDEGDRLEEFEIESFLPLHLDLMTKASENLLVHAWMSPHGLKAPTALFNNVVTFLSTRLKLFKVSEEEKKKKLEEVEGKVVSTTKKEVCETQLRLEVACQVARCHQLLTTIGSEKDISVLIARQIQGISTETLKLANSSNLSKYHAEVSAMFGAPFLQLLVCWSGLHTSPWSCCNVSQARSICRYVQQSLKCAAQSWGRKLCELEELLINIAEADSESGVLSGGMTSIAEKKYEGSVKKLQGSESGENALQILLRAHCVSSLTRIQLRQAVDDSADIWLEAANAVKSSMKTLQVVLVSATSDSFFYVWRGSSSYKASVEYHISLERQLVAELLMQASKPNEAKGFLEAAAKDSPQNDDVAFAYGSFLLRMALYNDAGDSTLLVKAQKQLLKSAKLNVKKADPFALLGLWYEVQGDPKRSIGCYSKALLLEPSNPVAGRGILRLKSSKDVSTLCQSAMAQGIFQNGWAWKCVGDLTAFIEGDDERAILCYQQALRARDIANPQQHRLVIFFTLPSNSKSPHLDCASTWACLGGCYRRLGKHSASVRAFQSAFDIFPSDLNYFCTWAQVELELGLLVEAAEKFERVLHENDLMTRFTAAYGFASCMLVMARQSTEEGKYGNALQCLKKGITALQSLVEDNPIFCCVWKLFGDLYSHASMVPPSVFIDADSDANVASNGIKEKLEFVAKGEEQYRKVLAFTENVDTSGNLDHEMSSLQTTALNDLAINFLLRARIRGEYLYEGSGVEEKTSQIGIARDEECQVLLDSSVNHFIDAIESNPLLPASWSGLGTALVPRDPMLAQHAFCRALQLDKGTEAAWSNLSLLYFDNDKVDPSEEAVDSLTQVADSAIMWIARGMLLEKEARAVCGSVQSMSKASDAYRASLQISRNQAALLGLSLTSRRLGVDVGAVYDDYVKEASKIAAKESFANLEMYNSTSAGCNLGALALSGIMSCEKSLILQQREDGSVAQAKDLLKEGKLMIAHSMEQLKEVSIQRPPPAEIQTATKSIHTHPSLHTTSYTPAAEISKILASCTGVYEDDLRNPSKYELGADTAKSIQNARQNVILHPDNGSMWINLVKALLISLSHDTTDESFQSVRAVVEKTKRIMVSDSINSSILHPTSKTSSFVHRTVSCTPIASSQLSEIYSLSDYVEDMSPKENDKKGNFDFQRAVLLNPESCFVRSKMAEEYS